MDKPEPDKSVAFITLTNNGYFDYTDNLLRSIARSGMDERLKVYCLDRKCHERFRRRGIDSVLIDHKEDFSAFQKFREGNWHNVVSHKFLLLHQNLLENEYVLMIDGDIVFQSDKVIEYLLANMGNNDLYIQNNGMSDEEKRRICSGFMFIRSNRKTIKLFNPENIRKHVRKGWGDQIYVQGIIDGRQLKFDILPLELFPNGRYFYENHERINPYIIHFNWITGHDKKMIMGKHGKWFGEKC